jgi:hypothetical protein
MSLRVLKVFRAQDLACFQQSPFRIGNFSATSVERDSLTQGVLVFFLALTLPAVL